jgi:hypothetical protein
LATAGTAPKLPKPRRPLTPFGKVPTGYSSKVTYRQETTIPPSTRSSSSERGCPTNWVFTRHPGCNNLSPTSRSGPPECSSKHGERWPDGNGCRTLDARSLGHVIGRGLVLRGSPLAVGCSPQNSAPRPVPVRAPLRGVLAAPAARRQSQNVRASSADSRGVQRYEASSGLAFVPQSTRWTRVASSP